MPQQGRTSPPPLPNPIPEPIPQPQTIADAIALAEQENAQLDQQIQQTLNDGNREVGRLQGIKQANQIWIARMQGLPAPEAVSAPAIAADPPTQVVDAEIVPLPPVDPDGATAERGAARP